MEAKRPVIGVLMIPRSARVVEDLQRWGIERSIEIAPHGLVDEVVGARVRGQEVMVFASPRRRWLDVAEAIRAAVQTGTGLVGLRFYSPDMVLGVRLGFDAGGYCLCPTVELSELKPNGGAYFRAVYGIRRAVKDAIADLIGAEMRRMQDELQALITRRAA